MSKHTQVGHTKAQAPQPRQRRLCSAHSGLSNLAESFCCRTLASKAGATVAGGITSAWPDNGWNASFDCAWASSTRALPLSVRTSATKPPLCNGESRMSLPCVSSGREPTEVQKHDSSACVQERPTTVVLAMRALKNLSLLSQLNTTSRARKARASHGRRPTRTVGCACGSTSSRAMFLPSKRYLSRRSTLGKTTPLAETIDCPFLTIDRKSTRLNSSH